MSDVKCKASFVLKIGSYNYESSELFFVERYTPDTSKAKTVLSYTVEIEELPQQLKSYLSDTGKYVVEWTFLLTLAFVM